MWKTSVIVPIPKASDMSAPSNYRPISLLPLLSKLLEKHFHFLISQHLQSRHILSNSQWGFTEGRSTVAALIKCVDDWLKTMESGKEICFDWPSCPSLSEDPILGTHTPGGVSPKIDTTASMSFARLIHRTICRGGPVYTRRALVHISLIWEDQDRSQVRSTPSRYL